MHVRVGVLDVDRNRGGGVPDDAREAFERKEVDQLDNLVERASQKAIRVLAGEFNKEMLTVVKSVRQRIQMHGAAFDVRKDPMEDNYYVSSSAVFMVGPVGELTNLLHLLPEDKASWPVMDIQTRGCGVKITGNPPGEAWRGLRHALTKESHEGSPYQDDSSGWNNIPVVKEKACKIKLPDTKKLCLYIGGKESRRGDERQRRQEQGPRHDWQSRRCGGKGWRK